MCLQPARKQHAKNITRQYRVERTFAVSTTRTKVRVVPTRLQHVKISGVSQSNDQIKNKLCLNKRHLSMVSRNSKLSAFRLCLTLKGVKIEKKSPLYLAILLSSKL